MTFNMLLQITNEDVWITHCHNRRYMICNTNTCYVGNYEYFDDLKKNFKKIKIKIREQKKENEENSFTKIIFGNVNVNNLSY